MKLKNYRSKRDFTKTPEPHGERVESAGGVFVVQQHRASRMHYDFRLELDGVLKSWAVPKGPCLDADEKRLAVEVEDHPLEYKDFEGVIPEGEYGAGEVIVWDRGVWNPEEPPREAYERGNIKFELKGSKLRGEWALVRMKVQSKRGALNWLLVKKRDKYARPMSTFDVLKEKPKSILTKRTIEEVRTSVANRPTRKTMK